MTAPITYDPAFIGAAFADVYFDRLWNRLPWENREGAPRRECWFNPYGLEYTYGSGKHARTYKAHPMNATAPNEGDMIDAWVAMLNDAYGTSFDCCFVNGYAHGRQHLGWHADDSPEMDLDHPIAIVSLGAAREIWFRGKVTTKSPYDAFAWGEPQDLLLGHGSLCIMQAGMQRDWQHRIPKSTDADCGPRLSLTFRKLVRA